MKGFEGLIDAAQNAAAVDARRKQQLQNARNSDKNAIQRMLNGIYQETGKDLAPALRPFWVEHVDRLNQQVQNMTLVDGVPITSIAQGQELLFEAENFYDHLYNFNHFDDQYAPEDEIELIESLISDPVARRKFQEKAPVDKNYQLDDAVQANSRLAQMQDYADIGFIGATREEILDGTYTAGGYKKYGEIDYSGSTPRLRLNSPNGVVDRRSASGYAQAGSYLDGLSIYGPNHQGLFNVERFAVDREAKSLFALGQEYLQPQVKADRVQLGWDRGTANRLAPGVVDDTTKSGQEIRYAMLTQAQKDNPNIFTEAEERAFLFNNPRLAFELDQQGNVQATEEQLANLQTRFDRLKSNADYVKELVNGSKYDRAVRQDTREDRQSDLFADMLAGMTTLNPNDIFSIEQIEEEIDAGRLLYGTANGVEAREAFHLGYARLLAEKAVLGQQVQPGQRVSDIVIVGAPSFALAGQRLREQAGVTRSFIEQFEIDGHHLPQTIGRFPINSTGSTELQFSPQTGVEGNIDTVFFTENDQGKLQIGVALNKSGVTGFGVGTLGLPIVPLEGEITFGLDTPLFDVVTASDGSQSLRDKGRVGEGGYLAGKTFTTDTPELVFYFDPTSDISKLNTLGAKLDALYGKTGQRFPNAVNPSLGYTLNAMFDRINKTPN
jgi:hypothetical protein